MADEQQASKSNVIMGIGATVAICTVLLALGKLYGDKVDDIGDDVKSIHQQIAVVHEHELQNAERFGAMLSRLNALESR